MPPMRPAACSRHAPSTTAGVIEAGGVRLTVARIAETKVQLGAGQGCGSNLARQRARHRMMFPPRFFDLARWQSWVTSRHAVHLRSTE
jgi:hypothetical protein